MLSVVIPSRNELFMPQTVDDILRNATGEIEVVVVLDGYWPTEMPKEDKRITFLHRGEARGMRQAINDAAMVAKGKYLMKVDAHCCFGPGFDEILEADCDDNWVVIPRRYSLDPDNWSTYPKTPVDYHFLNYPWWHPEERGMHGNVWLERARERLDIKIDDEMSFQGSAWFTTRDHYWKRIGGLTEEGYGTFIGEPQEVGNKTWLGGGRVIVNKNTWYAHLHKGKRFGRGYFIGKGETSAGNEYSWQYWYGNKWEDRIHDMAWLIEKFWPVPSWPESWLDDARKAGFK